ncbi:hypothetical protein NFH48_34435, partial [Pseudomonas aeruginosa]|uniref:hypothetical protein n=1 Tax=Pseudomonas aeruginosa TaxID=287 RepID=UPI0020768291
KLDVPATQVYALDCTYSSRLPDERTALQVIQALTNVSSQAFVIAVVSWLLRALGISSVFLAAGVFSTLSAA